MHEIPCSEPVCWLKEFYKLSAPTLPAPRFCIGQEVNVSFRVEECDRTLTDQGVIIGVVFRFPEALVDGWWYAIQFSRLDSCDWMPLGHIDWAHESQVRVSGTM